MHKSNLKIKDQISFQDKINAIEFIAAAYFTTDENQQLIYTPYFSEAAQVEAIAVYFLDGITFEDGENIYESIMSDEELTGIINRFYIGDDSFNQINRSYQELFAFIINCAIDKVTYRKQEELAKIKNQQFALLSTKLLDVLEKEAAQLDAQLETHKLNEQTMTKYNQWLTYQNQIAEQFSPEEQAKLTRDMAAVNFDPDNITSMLADKYFDSLLQKQTEELAEAQRTIQEQNIELEKIQDDYARQQEL